MYAPLSRHARAQAIDINGFVLADGRHIGIGAHWNSPHAPGLFLHAVHEGGCRVSGMLLGPDYNAQHCGHFHL